MGIDVNGDKVELQACVGRKGNKDGTKLKSLPFTFANKAGTSWAEAMRTMVFGKNMPSANFTLDSNSSYSKGANCNVWNTMAILVLIDKGGSKGGQKHFESLIKPVFEAAHRPFQVKCKSFYRT